jgi:hypothetical protein
MGDICPNHQFSAAGRPRGSGNIQPRYFTTVYACGLRLTEGLQLQIS